MTREAWLQDLVGEVTPWFAEVGVTLPEVRISTGFTSKGARSNRIGECWHGPSAADGLPQIFVHPRLTDSIEVGGVVVHELIHAGVGTAAGHGAAFKRPAVALGLQGRMTSTHVGPQLAVDLDRCVARLGKYPHASLHPGTWSSNGKKQTTRMIKCECPECGYLVRTSSKWLDRATPTCPIHYNDLIVKS